MFCTVPVIEHGRNLWWIFFLKIRDKYFNGIENCLFTVLYSTLLYLIHGNLVHFRINYDCNEEIFFFFVYFIL